MRIIIAFLFLLPFNANAEEFCNNGVPYYPKKTEYGYSIAMLNRMDYCIIPFHNNERRNLKYVCLSSLSGSTFRLDITIKGGSLLIKNDDGILTKFNRC